MPNTAVISNLANDSLSYSTAGTTLRLDVGSNATFSGIPQAQLFNGEIRVHFVSGGAATDTLGIAYDPGYAVGTANEYQPGLIYVNTGVGGYPIGTVAGGGSGTDLVLTYGGNSFAATDAVAATQIILRSLTFNTTAPGTPDRVLSVTVKDTNGDFTAPVLFGVNHNFGAAAQVVQNVPSIEAGGTFILGALLLVTAFITIRRRP